MLPLLVPLMSDVNVSRCCDYWCTFALSCPGEDFVVNRQLSTVLQLPNKALYAQVVMAGNRFVANAMLYESQEQANCQI